MRKIKTLRSHTDYARFLAQLSVKVAGWLPRKDTPAREPYRSGPTVCIYSYDDKFVWVGEVAHRKYEVWEIPPRMVRSTEAEAEKEQFINNP